MDFDGLLPLAKKLASTPLESSKTFNVYDRLYPLKANEPPQGLRLNQANTICDLNAFVVMTIAAGVTRVEAMKRAVSAGQAYERDFAGGKDRAWCFRRNTAELFEQSMIDWCNLPGNGVVQFKFFPQKGAHTFAVERVTLTDARDANSKGKNLPRFRVYQAYEGIYRLSDFLQTAGDEHNYLSLKLDEYFESHSRIHTIRKAELREKLEAKRRLTIANEVTNFERTSKALGGGRALIWSEFEEYVLAPLKGMLSGGIPSEKYSALTGVPRNQNIPVLSCEQLLVLMCDRVTPNDFATNYDALPAQGMSGFVDFP